MVQSMLEQRAFASEAKLIHDVKKAQYNAEKDMWLAENKNLLDKVALLESEASSIHQENNIKLSSCKTTAGQDEQELETIRRVSVGVVHQLGLEERAKRAHGPAPSPHAPPPSPPAINAPVGRPSKLITT